MALIKIVYSLIYVINRILFSVWEGTLQLYIRHWRAGLFGNLCNAQSDGCIGCLNWSYG